MQRPLPAPDLGPVIVVEKPSGGLKPLKPMDGSSARGFPSAAANRDKVYSNRPQQTGPAMANLNPVALAGSLPGPTARAPPPASTAMQPSWDLGGVPRPTATHQSKPASSAAGRELLGGNDVVDPTEVERLDSRESMDPSQCVGLAMRVIRSALPAQRAVALSALDRSFARDREDTRRQLLQSVDSGQRLFLLVRCVGDANGQVHQAAIDLLTRLLAPAANDDAKEGEAIRLGLYGAPAVEDADAISSSPAVATGDLSFEEIAEVAFSDPWGAASEVLLHVRVAESIRYEQASAAAKAWRLLEAIGESQHGAKALIGSSHCATAIRKALDVLLVEGLLLMDSGCEIAAFVAGVLRRCAATSKRAATLLFANYGEVLSLLVTTIISELVPAPSADDAHRVLANEWSKRCCMNVFSLFANCARHGLWRDDMTDTLLQGSKYGSLCVIEALVLTRGSGIHKSLKSFINDAVVRAASQSQRMSVHADVNAALERTTAMHLLATWYTRCTFETFSLGEKSAVDVVQSIESLSKSIAAGTRAAEIAMVFSTPREDLADRCAAVHGQVRLIAAIAKLLPKTLKGAIEFCSSVCEAVAGCDSTVFQLVLERRRVVGPAVAALLEVLQLVKRSPTEEGPLAPVRTQVVVKAALMIAEMVRLTQQGLDAVHDLLLPLIAPPIATHALRESYNDAVVEAVHTNFTNSLAAALLAEADNVDDERHVTATLVPTRLPWFLQPAFHVAANDVDLSQNGTRAGREAWVLWARWLLGHLGFRGMCVGAAATDAGMAVRFLLAAATSWMQVDLASNVRAEFDAVLGAAVRALLLSASTGLESTRPRQLSPILERFLQCIGDSPSAASPQVFLSVLALSSAAVHVDLRLAVLTAWCGNYPLARQSADLGAQVAAVSDLSSACDGAPLAQFIGRWRGDSVLQLVDIVAECFAFGGVPASAPIAVYVAEVIERFKLVGSAFETEGVDEAVSRQLESAGFDLSEWRVAGADSTLLDLLTCNASGMVD
jgi:hypothetical protein